MNCQNWVFRRVRGLKIDSKEVEGGSDGKMFFSENERSLRGLYGRNHE